MFLKRINNLLSGMLIFIFVFLLLEGSVRVGYTIFKDIRRDDNSTTELWHILTPYLGWERKSYFKGTVDGVEREFDSEGFYSVDTLQKSDTTKPKVLCLGDSNTFGFAVPTSSTFVELVDSWLPDVNLINLGIIGYTSFQGYKIFLKYGLELNPDIVIVSFNYNDRRYVLSKHEIDGDLKFKKMYEQHIEQQKGKKLRKFLDKVYFYRAMRFTFENMGLVNPNSKDINEVEEIHLDNLYPRVDPENYRRNLVKIVELAKSKDIAVIFMTLKDDPTQTSYLRKGIEFFKESQYDLAIENLKLAVQRGRINYMSSNISLALARIYLAKAYEKKGLLEEAKEVLIFKKPFISLHGGLPIYLDTEYNQIMKEVAEEYDVELVDAGQDLDENPSDYIDICHLDMNGHRKIATLLYERISKILSENKESTTFISARPEYYVKQ